MEMKRKALPRRLLLKELVNLPIQAKSTLKPNLSMDLQMLPVEWELLIVDSQHREQRKR